MSKRQSVLYFPYSTLLSRVKGHKGSPVLPRLLPSIVMGSLLLRAHFESLRAAEAKNSATINQLKYRSRSCITANIALGAWSRANKALGCASCFIGSRPHPRAIFAVMHSHGTLTSIYVHIIVIMYVRGIPVTTIHQCKLYGTISLNEFPSTGTSAWHHNVIMFVNLCMAITPYDSIT